MPPLVSIITPCYNQAHFLAEALNGALAQDYPAVEVVVVNDGSPDGAAIDAVIAALPREVTYIRQENRGIGRARNAALARCRGEFVQFLDADDRLLPNAVREGVAAFDRHPECALVWGYRRTINARGEVLFDNVGEMPHECRYVDLLATNIIGPPVGVMVRRDRLVEIGGFSTEPDSVEDYDMYLRLAARHPIHCHQRVIAEYRYHTHNISRDHARMLRGVLRALDIQQRHVGANRVLRQAIRVGRRDAYDCFDWTPRIEQLRQDVRAGRWRRGLRDAIALAARYPVRFCGALLGPLRKVGRREPLRTT
jgi:glycosyltransferase involved in cell wall biosynthesis